MFAGDGIVDSVTPMSAATPAGPDPADRDKTTADVPHEGGFRARIDVTTERGGQRYPELNEEMRRFMDLARYACPDAATADRLIDELRSVNATLAQTQTDEWHSPAGTRVDLPARGNLTVPPYTVAQAGPDGVSADVTFRPFHLGGNAAAHGGQVAVVFDDLGGLASALAVSGITRTAYLTVQYRSLTPLDVALACRTWVERLDGRKAFVRGTLHDGDRLCAELDALFVALRPGQP